MRLGTRESGLGTCGAGGMQQGWRRVLVSSSSAMGYVTCDTCVMCHWQHRWRQGQGVVVYRVGVHGGVAVGQGRERGARCKDVHRYVLAPTPPLPALAHSRKGLRGHGWLERGWVEVGLLSNCSRRGRLRATIVWNSAHTGKAD